ncbi:prepilin-type N-terminal cleavage/methylation domain-containing protein [Cellulomonas sp. zg-ZUI222]|uniref:Prepilin-type N-terminal cleavage/methylation domain-containing protein n=2 Tax=Cellulomonas wangleii TaxID=2816956 RepID=A0ABX8D978_9CELL|nr:prepilin-type N-terminal cleavage/methylation domain-containing protein [Cellulomonas wangleii]MBO0922795.1 prepilin-type N-terminal cleavage/methylation domain-containing protein [Cellulomonas wangleii]MBO0926340.1 prepilin-type N-terminal cleavage/methylation domain-containing protein [Cellulomonas wangleii]QVI63975.1 prepilin-type N-terminal cleavage/methylation domain-containing protein [Cellulomonas wangleii]
MMARVRTTMQKRAEGEKGFTLIELLVVIIIIGILAAIAIPAFLSQRTRGWVAQVESDLKNAAIAAETYAVGNNGSYENLVEGDADEVSLGANGYNATQDVTVSVDAATETGFVLSAVHANLDAKSWTYDSATGVIEEESGE